MWMMISWKNVSVDVEGGGVHDEAKGRLNEDYANFIDEDLYKTTVQNDTISYTSSNANYEYEAVVEDV